MRRQASAQATVQELSGAKASAREATGRAYACTEHVPQRSPLGGLVRENDGVAHDARGGVQQRPTRAPHVGASSGQPCCSRSRATTRSRLEANAGTPAC